MSQLYIPHSLAHVQRSHPIQNNRSYLYTFYGFLIFVIYFQLVRLKCCVFFQSFLIIFDCLVISFIFQLRYLSYHMIFGIKLCRTFNINQNIPNYFIVVQKYLVTEHSRFDETKKEP